MEDTFFISDIHFGHRNCLAFDNRPFMTIEENDEAIINNWNTVVGYDDNVWILGDVSWYNVMKTMDLLSQLNGNLNLIIGNHDWKLLRNQDFRKMFKEIEYYKELKINDKNVVLCHYPIPSFNNHYYGAYHLYGYVHTGILNIKKQMQELYSVPCNMYNVGAMVDYMNYTPKTLEDII